MTSRNTPRTRWSTRLAAALALGLYGSTAGAAASEENAAPAVPARVEFNRDVRPILSDNCFPCHGPDKNRRKADLRLDLRDEALKAEVHRPGQARRERAGRAHPQHRPRRTDAAAEVEQDARRPAEGDPQALDRSRGPSTSSTGRTSRRSRHEVPAGQNAVDVLVRRRLAEVGLKPSPEADRRTLIRRLSFDLLGLPPTPEEVDGVRRATPRPTPTSSWSTACWPARTTASGWRSAGSTWCASPTRSATTATTRATSGRTATASSRAFNDNKPFDRFTARATRRRPAARRARSETRVGSAFNRLLLTTEEGGAQAEGLRGAHADRPRPRRRHGVAGPDHRLRAVPRSQVRPVHDARLLRAGRVLRRHPGADHRPARGRHARRHAGAGDAAGEARRRTSPRRRSSLDAVRPSSTPRSSSGRRTCRATASRCRSCASDSKATPSREDGRAAGRRRFEEGAEGTQRRRNARRSRTTSAARRRRCSAAERDAVAPRRSASAGVLRRAAEVPGERPQRHAAHGAHPAARQLDGRERRGRASPRCRISCRSRRSTGRELTRLDLAQWLVSRDNPLTARTVVNRLWKQFFGIGPVQGARRPRRAGRAAGQSRAARLAGLRVHGQRLGREAHGAHDRHQPDLPAGLDRDAGAARRAIPYNRELARQSRFRLDAELVRDNALAVAGLLVPKIGGPSVKPYQPDGYWENLNFPAREYVDRHGARASIAAASTPGGSARSCTRACSPSTRRAARNAPPSAAARTSRSRRSCC